MRKSILYLSGLAITFAISITIFSQKRHAIPPVPPAKLEVGVPQPPAPPPHPANINTVPETPALPPAPPPPPPAPKEVI